MAYQLTGLLGLIIVACLLLGGTFVLLALGRPVPDAIWAAWGVVITALFGHGVFLAQAQTHQRVISDMLDAVSVGAGAATTGGSGTITDQRGTAASTSGPPIDTGGASGPMTTKGG